ncbi:MAG: hypothetical protein PF450_05560, partial [Bacteroidales bacterium]|nr:hypothetical protein [Bacteroidales bacterium]
MNKELGPKICKSHRALCSPEGISEIIKGINAENLSGLLLAGCGKGVKDAAFRFENDLSLERVNLRELVAWSMEPGAEDTIMAAEDYIRMGYAGLKQLSVVKPFILDSVSE